MPERRSPAPRPDQPATHGRLILVCGLPGSGKTTLAEEFEQTLGAVRFSPDDWMTALGIDLWDGERRMATEQLQWSMAQPLLARGATVVIEWGLWTRAERDALRLRARELGAAVELRFLDAAVDVLWERVNGRGREERVGSAAITREHLEQWDRDIERPGTEELALYD